MKLKRLLPLFLMLMPLAVYPEENPEQNPEQNTAVIKAISDSLTAQMSTNPADIKARIRASLVSQREYIKVKLEAMSDPETAALLARFSRVYYEALIKEGFSAEEAMKLLVSNGVPQI